MPNDEWFVDTNVLLDCTSRQRPRYALALRLLQEHAGIVMSAQIAREYVAVATRPTASNGLGMATADALENLAEFRRVARLLPEEKSTLPGLLALLERVPCRGNAVHDAHVVATMLVHRVRTLVTSNPQHFDRFADSIVVCDLEQAVA